MASEDLAGGQEGVEGVFEYFCGLLVVHADFEGFELESEVSHGFDIFVSDEGSECEGFLRGFKDVHGGSPDGSGGTKDGDLSGKGRIHNVTTSQKAIQKAIVGMERI
jgi:hypothetical protein